MTRINFSKATQTIAAERAGYRCSFPLCSRTTNGPGDRIRDVSRAAIASHIFSASPTGPRGRGGLTDDELKNVTNCIWLCSTHGTLVDKNKGIDYPSAVLHSYKQLHESRIQKELKGISSIIGWFHELEIVSSNQFLPSSKARFGKLTLLYGDNASGKSALCNLVKGLFQPQYTKPFFRALGNRFEVRLKYFQPSLISLRMIMDTGHPFYEIDGVAAGWNPLPLKIISVSDLRQKRQNRSSLKFLCMALSLDVWQVKNLVAEINSFSDSHIRNVRFDGHNDLWLTFENVRAPIRFSSLSEAEEEIVIMEFATAAARLCGRYGPTLLVLDHPFMSLHNWFDYYETHLLDPNNQFQTLMCTPKELDLQKAPWSGWDVVHLHRKFGSKEPTLITQEPKPKVN